MDGGAFSALALGESSNLAAIPFLLRSGSEGPRIALLTEINNKINTPPQLPALGESPSTWLSSPASSWNPSLLPRGGSGVGSTALRPPTSSKPSSSSSSDVRPSPVGLADVSGAGGKGSSARRSLTWSLSVRPGKVSRESPSQSRGPAAALLRWQCPRGRCAAGGRAGCRTCGARAPGASWGGWACSPACRGRGRGGGAP